MRLENVKFVQLCDPEVVGLVCASDLHEPRRKKLVSCRRTWEQGQPPWRGYWPRTWREEVGSELCELMLVVRIQGSIILAEQACCSPSV